MDYDKKNRAVVTGKKNLYVENSHIFCGLVYRVELKKSGKIK
jgi:hypothetical protein